MNYEIPKGHVLSGTSAFTTLSIGRTRCLFPRNVGKKICLPFQKMEKKACRSHVVRRYEKKLIAFL